MKALPARLSTALIAICLALANCWLILRNPFNNDVAWYLYLGRELLAGKRLYVDFIETNPPLICFLSTIPVWIAGVLHADVKVVWTVLVTALCMGSAGVSAHYWGKAREVRSGGRDAIFLFLAVITLGFFFAFDFGQRDHLAFVAGLPVCGVIAARVRGRVNAAIFTAIAGGLLLALKPFFLLPWLLCIAWAVVVCGWKCVARWPEMYIVPAMSAVQPVLILFATPAYLRVARLVASLYSSYNTASWGSLLTNRFLLIALIGGVLAFCYPASPKGANSVRFASLTTLGWFLSGLLQRKGWHYHVLPAMAALSFTGWMILLDREEAGTKRAAPWRTAWQGAIVLVLLVAGVRAVRLRWDYPSGAGNLVPIVEREARGRRIIALATGMTVFPLVNDTDTHLGIRYNSLWLLPGLYARQVQAGTPDGRWHFRRPEQMDGREKEMFASVASALASEPSLLLVFTGEQQGMGSLRINLMDYFAQDARARAALQHYERVPVRSEYVVLRRIGENALLR